MVTLNGFQVHKTADCQPLLAWPSGLQVYGCQVLMSAAGQNAKYSPPVDVFRFAPNSGHCSMPSALRICAMDGSDQTHSITSSASAPKSGGSSIPVAFAVLTWINTAGAGCSTVTTCGRGGAQILARLPRAGRAVRSVKRKQSYRAPSSFGPASIISPCGAPLAALSIMRRCYPIQLREPLCIP